VYRQTAHEQALRVGHRWPDLDAHPAAVPDVLAKRTSDPHKKLKVGPCGTGGTHAWELNRARHITQAGASAQVHG